MKTIIGIDPGASGAIAAFLPDGTLFIKDLPTIASGGIKNAVEPHALGDIIRQIKEKTGGCDIVAYVEEAVKMPGNGINAIASNFECRGAIRGVLAVCNVPVVYVTSMKWKNRYNIRGENDNIKKEKARGFILQRWPQYNEYFKRKKDHNRAEATLIAMYGSERESATIQGGKE